MTSALGLSPAKGARLKEVLSRRPRQLAYGGGGARTRLVCGYLACDFCLAQLLLAPLEAPMLRLAYLRCAVLAAVPLTDNAGSASPITTIP